MWGASIIGFGSYTYEDKNKKQVQWMRIAFSPRKNSLVLYILDEEHTSIDKLNKLGKHKRGKSCLYINKLADVDVDVLKELIKDSLDYIDAKYGSE